MSLSPVERRRVAVSLGTAFAVSWTAGLGVYLAGGLADSPRLGGLPVTPATVLIATGYTWGPAADNAVARLAGGGLALRPGATETLSVPGAATGGPTGPEPEGVVGRTRDGGNR